MFYMIYTAETSSNHRLGSSLEMVKMSLHEAATLGQKDWTKDWVRTLLFPGLWKYKEWTSKLYPVYGPLSQSCSNPINNKYLQLCVLKHMKAEPVLMETESKCVMIYFSLIFC